MGHLSLRITIDALSVGKGVCYRYLDDIDDIDDTDDIDDIDDLDDQDDLVGLR